MSYIATVRYAEGEEGSQILGIYSTKEEAIEILTLYKRNASFEILEIQHFTKNLNREELLAIKPFITKNNDEFIKVNNNVYESQCDYLNNNNIGSKLLFHETVNR